MLPIRQTLNALPGLNRTEKAVLTEVCQLAEGSAAGGWCRASNPYLAEALATTERTISRRLAALLAAGLLLETGEGKARRLAPAPALRACYATDEATRPAAIAALNLDKVSRFNHDNHDTPNLDNLDKTGAQPRQNGLANLDKMGAQPRQNGSRVIGDHQDQYLDQQDPLTASERVALQKKIGDLQQQVLDLKAQLARMKAPPVAGRPPASYRDFEGDWPAQLRPPFEPPAFRAAWAKYAGAMAELDKPFRGNIGEQEALETLARFAAGDMQRALRILSHNITQRYRTLTNDDGTSQPRPAATSRQRSAGAGRVETLEPTRYGRNRGGSPQPAGPEAEQPAEAA